MRTLTLVLALAVASGGALSATLEVQVRDRAGAPVDEAVVWAVADGAQASPARRTAVMDQKNRTFIPHVLAIQAGTAVEFPNSDNVLHHVYSFSPAKQFQLPLYKGKPPAPVVFDAAGVVELGCNIHDRMSAFIVVVPTPHFGKTDDGGRITLRDLPAATYSVYLWNQSSSSPDPQIQRVRIADREVLSFVAK